MVVAIVAIVGGAGIITVSGVQDRAERDVMRSEIEQVRQAVERFHRDTGYLPRRGPFALVSDGGKIGPSDADHWPAQLAGSSSTERRDWFEHPANLYQLFEHGGDAENLLRVAGCLDRMLVPDADADVTWNANTARGHRGPYLTRDGQARPIDGLPAMPMVLDPWGRAYRLHVDPADELGPRLISFGPDGVNDSDATTIGGDDLAVFFHE